MPGWNDTLSTGTDRERRLESGLYQHIIDSISRPGKFLAIHRVDKYKYFDTIEAAMEWCDKMAGFSPNIEYKYKELK